MTKRRLASTSLIDNCCYVSGWNCERGRLSKRSHQRFDPASKSVAKSNILKSLSFQVSPESALRMIKICASFDFFP